MGWVLLIDQSSLSLRGGISWKLLNAVSFCLLDDLFFQIVCTVIKFISPKDLECVHKSSGRNFYSYFQVMFSVYNLPS